MSSDATGVIVAGDCHISPTIYTDLPGLSGDSIFALEQIVQHCIDQHADLVLAGDVFNSIKPPSDLVQQTIRILRRMADEYLDIHVLRGQHDYTDPPWVMVACYGDEDDRMTWSHGKSIYRGPRKIQMLDYMPRRALAEYLENSISPDVTTLVMHQLVQEAFDMEGVYDFSLSQVPDFVQEVILGDYHRPISFTCQDRRLFACYTGSTHMRACNEPVEKSVVFLKTSRSIMGPDEQPDRLALRTRPFLRYSALTDDELENVLSHWEDHILAAYGEAVDDGRPSGLAEPLVYLRYSGDIMDAWQRIQASASVLETRIHLRLDRIAGDPSLVTDLASSASGPVVDSAQALRIALDQEVDPESSPQVHSAAIQLLDSSSQPDEVLGRLREELVGD